MSIGVLLHGCATPLGGAKTLDIFEVRQEVAQFINPVRNSSGCQLTVVSMVEDVGRNAGQYLVGIDDEGVGCSNVVREINASGELKGYRFVRMQPALPVDMGKQNNQDLLHRVDSEALHLYFRKSLD